MSGPQLKLCAGKCDGCLTTRNRIVSGERAATIVRDCLADGHHFFCHKGDGHTYHCRGVHDLLLRKLGGSLAWRFATQHGIPVVEYDPDKLEG